MNKKREKVKGKKRRERKPPKARPGAGGIYYLPTSPSRSLSFVLQMKQKIHTPIIPT
jgi:hypothetical protein